MRVIIADDSLLIRERIKDFLNNLTNVEIVSEVANGVEALQLIREKKPDLAILDIRIPDINGIEVLKRIRELKMEVKVCMLTNYSYPQYKKRCLEAGADYFLSKIEDLEKINIVITDLLKELKLLTDFICNWKYEDHEEKQYIEKSK